MPLQVQSVSVLHEYVAGVMGRADHHAGNVSSTVLTLAGAILWRMDNASIDVLAKQGDMKNVLWVTVSGKRYAFSYEHVSGKIEMREGTTHGPVLHSFDNNTSPSAIEAIFRAL